MGVNDDGDQHENDVNVLDGYDQQSAKILGSEIWINLLLG